MKTFIKSLFLTLLFFIYSFSVFETGVLLEKRAMEAKEAKEAAQQAKTEDTRTFEEYHNYYEIVVSRIKTSELEGLNKDAMKTYIAGYDKRFKDVADIFYPNREKEGNPYGESFLSVFDEFKKAFDKSELAAYKNLILSTSEGISEEDTGYMFKEQPVSPEKSENEKENLNNPYPEAENAGLNPENTGLNNENDVSNPENH